MSTFRIKYNLILNDNILYDKEIKVKNKDNELIAKVSLENYLRRKYPTFKQLIINDCRVDVPDFFYNLFNI